MFVHVGTGTPTVQDVRNLRQLHVELDGVDDATGAAAIAEAGLGTVDGDHAWLDIARLRAEGDDTDGWRADFDAMIGYARTKGWVDGDRVRAHLVRQV
jgi:hypothetical protein